MSEWDTGESLSPCFRWSMLQDNVVSFVALELTASKFMQDNSMYPLFFFFFRHVVVGLRSCRAAGLSLIEFGWIGDKVKPHPLPLSAFVLFLFFLNVSPP